MTRSRSTVAILLVCLTVLIAGCSGFATDDSASGDEPEPDETGDLEVVNNEATEEDDQTGESSDETAADDTSAGENADDDASTPVDDEESDAMTDTDDTDAASNDEESTQTDSTEADSAIDSSEDSSNEESDTETAAEANETEEASADGVTAADESDDNDDQAASDGTETANEEDNALTDETDEDQTDETSDTDDTDSEMYQFETTVEVVDDDGESVEGHTVSVWPAGAPDNAEEYTTDENGAVVLEAQSSDPSDTIQMIVQVDDEERTIPLDEAERTETFTVDDGPETHTLTVHAEDVVTGEPANDAYHLLQQDGETIGEEQHGETATFEGLEDGEYELSVYEASADWAYETTIVIDGDDVEHIAEIDRMYVYWVTIEATLINAAGDPVEGEHVTFNGHEIPTDENGIATYDRQFHYAEDTEVTVEYGDESETFTFDYETAETETVTFETETDEGNDAPASLVIAS